MGLAEASASTAEDDRVTLGELSGYMNGASGAQAVDVAAEAPQLSGWEDPEAPVRRRPEEELRDLLYGDLVPTREQLIHDIVAQLHLRELLPACAPCTQVVMSKAEETAMMLNAGRFDRSAGVAAGFIGEHVHVCEHLSRWQRVAKSAGYAVSSRFAGLQSYLNN